MRRLAGTALVFLGCLLSALEHGPGDAVVASVPGPGSHGIHLYDLFGFLAAACGVALLWRR